MYLRKRLIFINVCLGLILCASLPLVPGKGLAQQSGKQDYMKFCAGCHGADGKGNGPDYHAIGGPKPPDLTLISRRNGGAFPLHRIEDIVDGRATIPSHNRLDMPIWGVDLLKPGETPNARSNAEIKARIDGIVRYIQSIQQR